MQALGPDEIKLGLQLRDCLMGCSLFAATANEILTQCNDKAQVSELLLRIFELQKALATFCVGVSTVANSDG